MNGSRFYPGSCFLELYWYCSGLWKFGAFLSWHLPDHNWQQQDHFYSLCFVHFSKFQWYVHNSKKILESISFKSGSGQIKGGGRLTLAASQARPPSSSAMVLHNLSSFLVLWSQCVHISTTLAYSLLSVVLCLFTAVLHYRTLLSERARGIIESPSDKYLL